jgi:hypothetical protein
MVLRVPTIVQKGELSLTDDLIAGSNAGVGDEWTICYGIYVASTLRIARRFK